MEGEAQPGQGAGMAWMPWDAWVHVRVREEGHGAWARRMEGARCVQKGPRALRVRAVRAVQTRRAQQHKGMGG